MPKAKAKAKTVRISLANSPPSNFKFGLKQVVEIDESNERGTIQARGEYANVESVYLVRYKQANGNATEAWWQESALSAV